MTTDIRTEALKQPFRNRTLSESEKDRHTVEFDAVQIHRSLQHIPVKLQDPETATGSDAAKQSMLNRVSGSWVALSTTPESLCASLSSLNPRPAGKAQPGSETRQRDCRPRTNKRTHYDCWYFRCKQCRLCDVKTCKTWPTWGLVTWQAFGLLTGAVGPAFLPPLAKEKGLSDNEATSLLTLIGGLDIACRLVSGLIAHYGLLKPHQMVILTLVLQGLLCQVSC